jgi:hypothetical protein
MPEKESTEQAQEQAVFTVPWTEKRKELGAIVANEPMIAQTWDVGEDLLFFFLMWLGTY